MECRVCSCTEFDPCVDEETGETCHWAEVDPNPVDFQAARPLCSFCKALQDAVQLAYGEGYEQPDSDEPLVQLATEGDLDEMIRRHRSN